MTGDQHYKAAERYLSGASYFTGDPGSFGQGNEALSTVKEAPLLTALAQAHATLALAAAANDTNVAVHGTDAFGYGR
jgi:hypothetical protein